MPVPISTRDQLSWAYLTGAINEVDRPLGFFTRLMFSNTQTIPAEVLELSYIEGERTLAPFVTINGEAVQVPGRSQRFANVSFPNIKLKRAMEAYELLRRRQAGTPIFVDGAAASNARARAIAEDSEIMFDMIANRLEWMAAKMIIDRQISYSVEDGASFEITVPYDSTNLSLDLAADAALRWDTGSDPNPELQFHKAKRALSRHGAVPNICVMGEAAAEAFLKIDNVKTSLDTRNYNVGEVTLEGNFDEESAIRLGRYAGMPVWEYSGQYWDGSQNVNFMDSDKVLFIATGGDNGAVVYYGAIPDHDAMEQGLMETRIFSKSWRTKDPSNQVQLVQSRPLPMMRRPNRVFALDPLA